MAPNQGWGARAGRSRKFWPLWAEAEATWRKKQEPEPLRTKSGAGAAKNMRLLYRLLEYNCLRQLYICKKTQLIYLFYISCSFTFVVCGGKIFWWSHLKMLTKFNEIYYDWSTDGLSTDWLGWEEGEKWYLSLGARAARRRKNTRSRSQSHFGKKKLRGRF